MSYLDLVQNNKDSQQAARIPIVFAASDITFIIRNECLPTDDTIIHDGKRYRRLTPEYWAWFYYKYTLMEKALTNGKISEATFVKILDRISKLYNHAITLFGKEALDEAVQTTDVREIDEHIKRENAAASGNPRNANARRSTPSLVVERGC